LAAISFLLADFPANLGEQRLLLRSVPSALLLRTLFCAGLALLPLGCTQTANSAATAAAANANANAPKSEEDLKTQCWMKQETGKNVNNIDAKIAAVDKCIAEGKKNLPPAS